VPAGPPSFVGKINFYIMLPEIIPTDTSPINPTSATNITASQMYFLITQPHKYIFLLTQPHKCISLLTPKSTFTQPPTCISYSKRNKINIDDYSLTPDIVLFFRGVTPSFVITATAGNLYPFCA
jgi:hypothetical protein